MKALADGGDPFFRDLVEGSPVGFVLLTEEGVQYANGEAQRLFGIEGEVRGRTLPELVGDVEARRAARMLRRMRRTGARVPPFELVVTGEGAPRTLQAYVTAVDYAGRPAIRLVAYDITARKALEDRLRREALHDALTGLPNRTVFRDHVRHAIARAERRRQYRFAVLYVDLDNFKTINDGFGHASGDTLLAQFARRLERCVRPSDVAARWGGDEFTILLDDLGTPEDATVVADRIRRECAGEYSVHGRELNLSLSIGIAFNGSHRHADALVHDADVALYRAKGSARGTIRIYDV
ncbi:MAG TPA: sensor domain-containing diguanylate cyclase, partial [Longimicrobiales bacterium]